MNISQYIEQLNKRYTGGISKEQFTHYKKALDNLIQKTNNINI
jgi:hypothetical protein